MRPAHAVDVVVAGGGMAGVSVAAALREFGYEVLVVDAGLDASKRLAGELIHPPGTTDLAELGLLRSLEDAGGMPVLGFAVLSAAARGEPEAHVLPYARAKGLRERGFAMEHVAIAEALGRAVEKLPHVTVWHGARVTGLGPATGDAVAVTVLRGSQTTTLTARLVVGADGPPRRSDGSRASPASGVGSRRCSATSFRVGTCRGPGTGRSSSEARRPRSPMLSVRTRSG